MLLCISGSHGEGKTTLLEEYMSKYQDARWIKNTAARDSLRELGMTLENVYSSKEKIVEFQELVLKKQNHIVEQANSTNILHVTERSYLDLLTYAILGIGGDVRFQDWLDSYAEDCMYGHELTSGLLHLEGRVIPMGGTSPENDGTRPTGAIFTTATTAIISHLAHQTKSTATLICSNPDLANRVVSLHDMVTLLNEGDCK